MGNPHLPCACRRAPRSGLKDVQLRYNQLVSNGSAVLLSGKPSSYTLVLGGSGFIGTRLVSLLEDRSSPVCIGDIQKSEAFPEAWSYCDVTQGETLNQLAAGASAIINLAAVHRDDILPLSRYHDVNVDGAVQVCQAARTAGVQKIVFTSSVAVYGFQPRPVDEQGPFEPFNEYGKTKLEAESVYRAWAEEDPDRSLVIVRPTVVFGEGNRGNVYNLLRQIASGRFLMVGSGTNVKSMAYVGNVAAFLAHCLSFGPGIHISNYVDGPDLCTRELVKYIYSCLGKADPVREIPKTAAAIVGHLFDVLGRISGRKYPISAIRVRKFCETTQFRADRVSEWGFSPPFSLNEGLARTITFEFQRL
jgi:GlcNAc-P-P-Und epimerase